MSVASQSFCPTARCLLTAACIPADDGLSSLPRCVGSPSVLVCVLLGPNTSKRHRGHRSQGSQLRASAAGETGTYVCVCVLGPRTGHGKDLGVFMFCLSPLKLMRGGGVCTDGQQISQRVCPCAGGKSVSGKAPSPSPMWVGERGARGWVIGRLRAWAALGGVQECAGAWETSW